MEAGLATVARAMSRPCQNLSRCHRQRFHSGQLGSMPPWSGSEAHTAVHGSCMAPPICMCIPCTHRSVHCVWCMHAYICMHMHAYACICMHAVHSSIRALSAVQAPILIACPDLLTRSLAHLLTYVLTDLLTGPHLDCVPRLQPGTSATAATCPVAPMAISLSAAASHAAASSPSSASCFSATSATVARTVAAAEPTPPARASSLLSCSGPALHRPS